MPSCDRTTGSAADFIPSRRTLPALRAASAACRGSDLWKRGTRTVFGEGPARARLVMVGEQPGHEEDLAGHPFVGPAGRILDRALAAARITRDDVYVTNVVKHFKWEPRGKRRIHAKPNQVEIAACSPWLEAELDLVRPMVVVCLGATAARALLGAGFRGHATTRAVGEGSATFPCAGDSPSLVDPPGARRRHAAPRIRCLGRGSDGGTGGAALRGRPAERARTRYTSTNR